MLIAATSCASRKKTVQPPQSQAFEWMTANLSIQAEGNGMAYDDLSGQMRMRNDSIVWFSVTATMGVEVLRAKFIFGRAVGFCFSTTWYTAYATLGTNFAFGQ